VNLKIHRTSYLFFNSAKFLGLPLINLTIFLCVLKLSFNKWYVGYYFSPNWILISIEVYKQLIESRKSTAIVSIVDYWQFYYYQYLICSIEMHIYDSHWFGQLMCVGMLDILFVIHNKVYKTRKLPQVNSNKTIE
jgi:hypothetical protein